MSLWSKIVETVERVARFVDRSAHQQLDFLERHTEQVTRAVAKNADRLTSFVSRSTEKAAEAIGFEPLTKATRAINRVVGGSVVRSTAFADRSWRADKRKWVVGAGAIIGGVYFGPAALSSLGVSGGAGTAAGVAASDVPMVTIPALVAVDAGGPAGVGLSAGVTAVQLGGGAVEAAAGTGVFSSVLHPVTGAFASVAGGVSSILKDALEVVKPGTELARATLDGYSAYQLVRNPELAARVALAERFQANPVEPVDWYKKVDWKGVLITGGIVVGGGVLLVTALRAISGRGGD